MKVSKKSLLKKNILPNTNGLMVFYKDDEVTYSTKTMNLYDKFEFIKSRVRDNSDIFAMLSQATDISWKETPDLFTALIYEKQLNYDGTEPKSNSLFYKDLAYLAIDFKKVPYFKLKDDTLSDSYFIGPFKSRFFVWDFIMTMMELYGYPACESEEFPCDFYKEKKCKGYCVKSSFLLTDILKKNYLKINSGLINDLNAKKESLSDSLMFNEEDLLKKQIKIIEKYYKYLKFYYVTKALNKNIQTDEFEVIIKNGLIQKIKSNGGEYGFPEYNIKFRDNEYLAIEKHQFDERWIIFDYVSNNWNDLVNVLYNDRMDNFIGSNF